MPLAQESGPPSSKKVDSLGPDRLETLPRSTYRQKKRSNKTNRQLAREKELAIQTAAEAGPLAGSLDLTDSGSRCPARRVAFQKIKS